MALLKRWPGKLFSWHLIRTCDTASFCKMWAAGDLPPGPAIGLQIVRNVLSEGRGLGGLTQSPPGAPPWSPVPWGSLPPGQQGGSTQLRSLNPWSLKSPFCACFSLLLSWIQAFPPLRPLVTTGVTAGLWKLLPSGLFALIRYREEEICRLSLRWARAELGAWGLRLPPHCAWLPEAVSGWEDSLLSLSPSLPVVLLHPAKKLPLPGGLPQPSQVPLPSSSSSRLYSI